MPVEERGPGSRINAEVARQEVGNLSTPISVQKLQAALHAAKAEPEFRFYALYDKLYRPDVLAHAYDRCRPTRAHRGVDRERSTISKQYSREQWLGTGAGAQGKLVPTRGAIKRVFIPKANGKLRPLGLSTFGIECA